MRQIGYHHQKIIQPLLHVGQLLLQRFQLLGLRIDFSHQGRGVFFLRFHLADLLGQRVTACLQFLRVGLHFLALGFQRLEFGGRQRKAAPGKALCHARQIAA